MRRQHQRKSGLIVVEEEPKHKGELTWGSRRNGRVKSSARRADGSKLTKPPLSARKEASRGKQRRKKGPSPKGQSARSRWARLGAEKQRLRRLEG